jgi:hypothetical protein
MGVLVLKWLWYAPPEKLAAILNPSFKTIDEGKIFL